MILVANYIKKENASFDIRCKKQNRKFISYAIQALSFVQTKLKKSLPVEYRFCYKCIQFWLKQQMLRFVH